MAIVGVSVGCRFSRCSVNSHCCEERNGLSAGQGWVSYSATRYLLSACTVGTPKVRRLYLTLSAPRGVTISMFGGQPFVYINQMKSTI